MSEKTGSLFTRDSLENNTEDKENTTSQQLSISKVKHRETLKVNSYFYYLKWIVIYDTHIILT